MYPRHPDDVKLYNSTLDTETPENRLLFQEDDANSWQDMSHKMMYDEYEEYDRDNFRIASPQQQGRPIRVRNQNPRYFNDEMVN